MKRILCVIAMTVVSLVVFAQNQQGYVKTKGRLGNNGTVIAGSRLPGATVQVKGSNAVVSGSNGTFTLAIPSNNYYLQSVQKQGYVVTDPDVLSHQYAYSKNPLVLVLETPSQQTDDRLAAEKKIRRTLQRQLQEKEDEIETLKEQQKLTEEEYRKQLQELYAQQESNEKLISEMADRYSKMDFDEVDEFNRRISSLILEGKLTEADSLLNTKGDINSRAANLRQHQDANAQAEQELKKKQKKLEKSKAMTQKELEDLAQDCYSKFEIFKMQHLNDSAAHYIELRASLDSTNVEWGIAAGKFYHKYLASYDKAKYLFERCLRSALTIDGQKSHLADCYEALASIYSEKGDYNKSLEYHLKEYDFSLSLFGEHHQYVVAALINIANVYRKIGDFDKAVEMSSKAIELMDGIEGLTVSSIVKIYGNIANLYSSRNQHNKALEYYLKAKEYLDASSDPLLIETITTYANIGYSYFELGQYEKALEWDQKTYDLIKDVLGDSHPQMTTILNNMCAIYLRQNLYEKALEMVSKSLEIDKSIYGQQSPSLIIDYNNLGRVQHVMMLYQKSLESYQVSLDLCGKHLPSNHPYVATLYNNMGSVFLDMDGEDDKAMQYFEKALIIRIDKFGENNSSVAMVYNNIGILYQMNGDKQNALLYLRKAKSIFEATLGKEHPNIKSVQKSIDKVLSLPD